MQPDMLTSIDGNARSNAINNPLDPLNPANPKPAPAFAQESEQHRFLHSQLLRQQQYVNLFTEFCYSRTHTFSAGLVYQNNV